MQKILLAYILTLCSSCADAPLVQNRLVPGNVVLSEDLYQETIYIEQGFGGEGYGKHRLTYELHPNDRLNVSYRIVSQGHDLAATSFHLDSLQANRAREALWRVRPATTSQNWMNESGARPLDCEIRGLHDLGEMVVVFISDNGDAGGSFELPVVESCDTTAAIQARQLLNQVISYFPRSDIASEFHKAEARDDFQTSSELPTPIPSLTK
jgi:hypothetical protein